jgi:hypothetical protein
VAQGSEAGRECGADVAAADDAYVHEGFYRGRGFEGLAIGR